MPEKKKSREDKVAPAGEREGVLALPIEWHFPEGLIGRFANQVLVQAGAHEWHLSFFEIQPPLLVGSPEEVAEQAKRLTSVRAECVARLVVAKEFLPSVIKALQEALDKQGGGED